MSKVTNHPTLTFPARDFRIEEVDGQHNIFDPVRKKMVALTPEEWVRQHVIAYLRMVTELDANEPINKRSANNAIGFIHFRELSK